MVFLTDIITSLAASLLGAMARCLCRPCYEEIKNSIQVLSTPESLPDYLQQLSNLANRIKAMSRLDEIDNWILEADKILQGCNSYSLNEDQQFCCLLGDTCLRYKLQKKIKKMIVQGNRIIKLANLMQPRMVEPIHGVPNIEDDTTAGRNLKRVMDMLKDDNICGISIWGPGGVGKTTLAKALNNKLNGTSFFSLVIFIQITKDVDTKDVQKAIAQRLGLKEEQGMNTRYVAEQIRNRLQREKFLLIVDNVWENIDFLSIGIPQKQAASKIVLTTRLQEVCTKMETKQLEIGYLTDSEAWQLFVENAGDVAKKEIIKPLAEAVCRECAHLPLALVVVGSAIKGKTDIYLWRSAINDLQCSIPISGIESQVYKALKLSYDWLENDTLKSCFLYCSLYPEGWDIEVSELVRCWLAEKLIDEQLYYENAFCKGLDSINKLVNSCLVERSEYYGDELRAIRMHDVVRDVVRWIAKSSGRSINFSGHGISRGPMVTLSEEVNRSEWISFVDNKQIKLPPYSQDFPKVTTILLHGTIEQEVKVSHEFLKGFQSLRVLSMRYLQSLPGSSLFLPELRALIIKECSHVEDIPCMSKLLILDLHRCSLHKIPREVRQLTHLKVLNLSQNTAPLKSVEVEVISNLKVLEVLDMRNSGYKWPTKRKSKSSEEATLQDLSGLKELKSIYLDLADVECTYEDSDWMDRLENFMYYHAAGGLQFFLSRDFRAKGREIDISGNRYTEVGSFILHAEILYIQNVSRIFVLNFDSINQTDSKLKRVSINACSFSEELIGLAPNPITLSKLEDLSLEFMGQIRSFYQIANGFGATFPNLRRLFFSGSLLWKDDAQEENKLRNFFSSKDPHMEFPKLEEIELINCADMTEVFNYGPAENHLVAPNLRILYLHGLSSLRRLCDYELIEQWQSLEILEVRLCPNLKSLPHMSSIKEIRGEEEWWDNLEWDSPETKSYMNRFFKEVREL